MNISNEALNKGKKGLQYQKSLSNAEEKEIMVQKIIEDIEDLDNAIQNIIDQYSHNKEIHQEFKVLEKQVFFLHNKYAKTI